MVEISGWGLCLKPRNRRKKRKHKCLCYSATIRPVGPVLLAWVTTCWPSFTSVTYSLVCAICFSRESEKKKKNQNYTFNAWTSFKNCRYFHCIDSHDLHAILKALTQKLCDTHLFASLSNSCTQCTYSVTFSCWELLYLLSHLNDLRESVFNLSVVSCGK